MRLLLILMSVMSFLVESRTKVSMDGIWPYDIEVSYDNTGQKGSVTAGQVATLSLTHLDGITIDQITVYVKSNKSSGAGIFTIRANGQIVTTKSGTFKEWTGNWDNTNYHAISFLNQSLAQTQTMEISLEGTANSLHIDHYDILWTQAAPQTVTLMNGNNVYSTMTEAQGNEGIILPSVPDSAEWKFRGWSEVEFWCAYSIPELYAANSRYYPEEDCRLWAVYEYQPEKKEAGYATELTDGEYRYVNSANNTVLTGIPAEGEMGSEPLNLSKQGQVYSIQFMDAETATITHTSTGTPIGYSGTQMAASPSPWRVYHEGEETIFYIENGGKKYVLWLNILDPTASYIYAGLMSVTALSSPMRLLPVVEEEESYFTCHPEVPQGLQITDEDAKEQVIMHLGNYQLKILNGKKIIEL